MLGRNLPLFRGRSLKTDHVSTVGTRVGAKTREPFPFEQADKATFARCRKLFPNDIDAKYTYFMRDRYSGLIKIGMARDPDDRRVRLSASGARDMEILLTLRDGCLERCYHRHFADLRVEGEWFEPHPDIFAEIARLQLLEAA
jgi:hypothetical protein